MSINALLSAFLFLIFGAQPDLGLKEYENERHDVSVRIDGWHLLLDSAELVLKVILH